MLIFDYNVITGQSYRVVEFKFNRTKQWGKVQSGSNRQLKRKQEIVGRHKPCNKTIRGRLS